jgi:GNAT superfamily N-acetyltransferase
MSRDDLGGRGDVEIFEASAELPKEPYLKLLLIAAFPRTPSEQIRMGEEFRDSPSHVFWVASVDGQPIGACAVIESEADLATIRYLGVEEPFRRQGVGRQLIEAAIQRTDKRIVEAETDANAKDFYRKRGFAIRSLGEKYPGIIRYVCTYTKPRSR